MTQTVNCHPLDQVFFLGYPVISAAILEREESASGIVYPWLDNCLCSVA